MKVAQIIAGYTLGQADILRRIMGKKKKEALAAELVKFKAGAVKNGFTEEHAEEIFHILEPFAGYGFNKSHAVAYSVVAYQTAYLKANFPAEFLAANLTNEMGNPAKFTEYLNLAPKYDLRILPPSINKSDKHFNVDNGDIIYGLAGIKGVGEIVVEQIVKEREANGPYKSFMDFLSRQGDGMLNSKMLESMIKAGAFDELGVDSATLLANLDDALKFDRTAKEATAYGQLSLFGDDTEALGEFQMKSVEPFPLVEKLQMEKEYLGFYISGHPLDIYKEQIAASVRADLSHPETLPMDSETSLIALVTSERMVVTQKKKEKMGFYTLQTKEGDVDAVAFPSTYEVIRDKVEKDQIYGFRGTFGRKDAESKISFHISSVCSPYELKPEAVSQVHIVLNQAALGQEELKALSRKLRDNSGFITVLMSINGIAGEELKAAGSYSVEYSPRLIEELGEMDIVNRVWIS